MDNGDLGVHENFYNSWVDILNITIIITVSLFSAGFFFLLLQFMKLN